MDGFNWKQYRKNCPIPSSSIPYGKYSFADDFGNVYSLDKFRPRFPILRTWDSEEKLVSDVHALLQSIVIGAGDLPLITHGAGRFGGNVHWWKFYGGIVTLHKFKPFGSDDFTYSILLEFNPNKTSIEPWRQLRDRLGDSWHNTRLDYALDIPFPISDVRLLTRKIGSSYQGTYYFGTRGSSGYTRVYDKRKELIDKQRLDIGREVTRIEWESHQSDPLCMDFPFILGDLGRHSVLRFVPMHDWPEALRTFDPKTASKIKRDCLTSVEVDQTIFDRLRDQLLSDLALDSDKCLDHIDKKRMDAADAESLEKIQSTLRKWSGVEH